MIFSSFVDEIYLACSVSSPCFATYHWHIWLSTQLQLYITTDIEAKGARFPYVAESVAAFASRVTIMRNE